MSRAQQSQRLAVAAAVLGMHLLGGLLWWQQVRERPPVQQQAARTAISIWLPNLESPVLAQNKETRPSARSMPAPSPNVPDKRLSAIYVPSTSSSEKQAPAPVVPASATTNMVASMPTPAASELNLSLSRDALKTLVKPGFAAQSHFQGKQAMTMERQVGNAFAAKGEWTQERLGDDKIRLRRGDTCVMVEQARAAALDPFSDYGQRLPARVSTPYKCE